MKRFMSSKNSAKTFCVCVAMAACSLAGKTQEQALKTMGEPTVGTTSNLKPKASRTAHWYVFSFLLGSPQVRRELGLSHELSVRVLDLLNYASYLDRGGLMSREEARQQQSESAKHSPGTLRARTVEILMPAQQTRLEQINYQRAGPFILQDAWVAQQIGVSLAQCQRAEQAQDRAYKNYSRTMKKLQHSSASSPALPTNPSQFRFLEQMQHARDVEIDQCYTALSNVLTMAQKNKLKSFLGKPFNTEHLTYDVRAYSMN